MDPTKHLTEKHVYLNHQLNDHGHHMYSVMFSNHPEDEFPLGILSSIDLEQGYQKCIEKIDHFFEFYNVPLDHRVVDEYKKVTYEYFEKISPFGFEH